MRDQTRDRLARALDVRVNLWFSHRTRFPRGNEWMNGELGNFYFRASARMFHTGTVNGCYWCLDFANLTAKTPGEGLLTFLLDKFERPKTNGKPRPYAAVYVEACTPRLGQYLMRRGYRVTGDVAAGLDGASYFKFVEASQ